jgi:hypothetical protein
MGGNLMNAWNNNFNNSSYTGAGGAYTSSGSQYQQNPNTPIGNMPPG